MKTELISVRFPKEDVEIMEEVAKDERTDRTSAMKKIFALGAREYRLEKAVAAYQKNKVSIGKACEIAGTSIWEMHEELKARGIYSNLSEEDFTEGLKNIEKAFGKK